MIKKRIATIKRKTKETDIVLKITLDGEGKNKIDTPIGFLNHMLDAMSKHALFNLELKAKGDIQVDDHHTVEDIGICLGKAIAEALKDKKSITRFGNALVPMDEALCAAAIDISGRPFFSYGEEAIKFEKQKSKIKGKEQAFDLQLIEEFFQALVLNSGITLHVVIKRGKNLHHIYEAMFKAVGRALKVAVAYDAQVKGIPSTKGAL